MRNSLRFFLIHFLILFLFALLPNGVRASSSNCVGLTTFYQTLGQLVLTHTSDDLEKRLCQKISKSDKRLSKGKVVRAIKKLNRVIKVIQKHVSDEINQATADLIIAEAGRLVGVLENNMGLPPDPGEAGKATLQGIDSDGDGVRDDIQRYIALTFPDSAKVRAVMTMSAKNFQQALIDANDKALSIQHMNEMLTVADCESFIDEELNIDMTNARLTFDAEMLNTIERSRAYLKFSEQLEGQIFDTGPLGPDNSHLKVKCDFNPDELPN